MIIPEPSRLSLTDTIAISQILSTLPPFYETLFCLSRICEFRREEPDVDVDVPRWQHRPEARRLQLRRARAYHPLSAEFQVSRNLIASVNAMFEP